MFELSHVEEKGTRGPPCAVLPSFAYLLLLNSATGSGRASAAYSWAWYCASPFLYSAARSPRPSSPRHTDRALRLRSRRPRAQVSRLSGFADTTRPRPRWTDFVDRSRDDPNVDENTRLRNRIAELESLVRELRGASPPPAFPSTHCAPALLPARSLSAPAGKPHPKWAEPNFCDGDATEKWHSRSSRRLQFPKGRDGGGRPEDGGRLPPAIKTEQGADPSGQHSLYRFTPSPPHTGVDASGQQYALYGRQTGGAAGGAGSSRAVAVESGGDCE